MRIPTVPHVWPDPPAALIRKSERLVESLSREHPELITPDEYKQLTPAELPDAPTLHLDDLSEISLSETIAENRFYQDRARLRAGDGDLIASCAPVIDGYEAYCRDRLGLGSPIWIRPRPARKPLRIAEACWEDSEIRLQLCQSLRQGELQFIHPHMGTLGVWELASLLTAETKIPLRVIAPPPKLTRWVNNKVAFMETVQRLFSPDLVPATRSAWNLAMLAKRVQELAGISNAIAIKLPDAAGGEGNVVMHTAPLRGKSLKEIDQIVRAAVSTLNWHCDRELLVDVWESNVIDSPSCQMWIPPVESGAPIIEGIFRQTTIGQQGMFAGAVPAQLPDILQRDIAEHCWLLANVFQGLGYIGRCSFDLILIGTNLQDCRFEFIECNGRWGGTSLPMTLMNRLFGDFQSQPFAVHILEGIQYLDRLCFAELLQALEQELFDIRTGTGSFIFYNPGRLQNDSGVSAIALGDSWEQASQAGQTLLKRLESAARGFANVPVSKKETAPDVI